MWHSTFKVHAGWLTVTLDVFKLDKLLKLYDELERLKLTLDVFKYFNKFVL